MNTIVIALETHEQNLCVRVNGVLIKDYGSIGYDVTQAMREVQVAIKFAEVYMVHGSVLSVLVAFR